MTLDDLDRRILDIIQTRFPVEPRPFHVLAEEVGSTEQDVLERIRRLEEGGVIRRIGPVFDTERMGYASTLCAASVTPDRVEGVAASINEYEEVTHNYLRDHEYNLWFTLTASSQERIAAIVDEVRGLDGVAAVMTLPAEGVYKIQVHFPMGGTMA